MSLPWVDGDYEATSSLRITQIQPRITNISSSNLMFARDMDHLPQNPRANRASRGSSFVEPRRPSVPSTGRLSGANTTATTRPLLRRTESTRHLRERDDPNLISEVRDFEARSNAVSPTSEGSGFNPQTSPRRVRASTLQDEPAFLPHPSGLYPNPKRNPSVKRESRLSKAEIQHLRNVKRSDPHAAAAWPPGYDPNEEPMCARPDCPLVRPHPVSGGYSVPCDPYGSRNVPLPEIINANVRIAKIENGEQHRRYVSDVTFLQTFDSADHADTSPEAREALTRIVELEGQSDWKQYGLDLDFLDGFEKAHGPQLGFSERQLEGS